MFESIRRLFGQSSVAPAKPAFDLTLTFKGQQILRLNQAQFDFMRDNRLLSEAFLQKVTEHMPNGGKQSWELRGGYTWSYLYQPLSFDKVTKTSPLGAYTQETVLRIESAALCCLIGEEILSKSAQDQIKSALRSFNQHVHTCRELSGFIMRSHNGSLGVSVYEGKSEHSLRLGRLAHRV